MALSVPGQSSAGWTASRIKLRSTSRQRLMLPTERGIADERLCPVSQLPQPSDEPRSVPPQKLGQTVAVTSLHRRTWLWIIGGIALLLAMGCIGVSFSLYKFVTDDSPATPTEAVTRYFQALKSKDRDALKAVVCTEHQQDVARILDEFYRTLDKDGFKIDDLEWTSAHKKRVSDSEYFVVVDTTLSLQRNGIRYERNEKTELTIVNNSGWYICGIK